MSMNIVSLFDDRWNDRVIVLEAEIDKEELCADVLGYNGDEAVESISIWYDSIKDRLAEVAYDAVVEAFAECRNEIEEYLDENYG